MKRLNLLLVGGRHCGKTTFALRLLNEALTHPPTWLNLRFSFLGSSIPGTAERNLQALDSGEPLEPMFSKADGEIFKISVQKRKIFWFSLLLECLGWLFLRRPMTEIGGVQVHVYEMSIENPLLGRWLLDHLASKTPLGVLLIADPFAAGKTCESRHEPAISAVAERLVERFEQIYVNNPGTRLPISTAVIVTKGEKFSQFQTASRRFLDASTLDGLRKVWGDLDGMLSDSYLLDENLKRQSAELGLLVENCDGNLVNILQNEFRRVRFFWSGKGAGTQAGSDSRCRTTSPLLPLLWLLAEEMEY